MNITDSLKGGILIIIYIAIGIAIFIAIREFWAWYLKTNKLIENQNKIIGELKKQTKLFGELSDKLSDLVPKKFETKEEEETTEVISEKDIQCKEPLDNDQIENFKVKCNDCTWEGKLNELKIKEDRMGKYEVCPNCGSGRWDNI